MSKRQLQGRPLPVGGSVAARTTTEPLRLQQEAQNWILTYGWLSSFLGQISEEKPALSRAVKLTGKSFASIEKSARSSFDAETRIKDETSKLRPLIVEAIWLALEEKSLVSSDQLLQPFDAAIKALSDQHTGRNGCQIC